MNTAYQVRWISKDRATALKKSGATAAGVLLNSFNGFLLVEPVGSELGDGALLSRVEADAELQPAWCLDSLAKLARARQLLGLESSEAVPANT